MISEHSAWLLTDSLNKGIEETRRDWHCAGTIPTHSNMTMSIQVSSLKRPYFARAQACACTEADDDEWLVLT